MKLTSPTQNNVVAACSTCGAAVATNGNNWIVVDVTNVPQPYRKPFGNAMQRLNAFITLSRRSVTIDGVTQLIGIEIAAKVAPIDGLGGTLGRAGPTAVLQSDGLPVAGIMEFDIADVANMAANGTLEDVVVHEMAHCLGVGTLWSAKGLIRGAGTSNPTFIGGHALQEYRTLANDPTLTGIPLANTGGPGTREGHWRERTFGDELFTGYISGNVRAISRMSVASLRDLGYEVNMLAGRGHR